MLICGVLLKQHDLRHDKEIYLRTIVQNDRGIRMWSSFIYYCVKISQWDWLNANPIQFERLIYLTHRHSTPRCLISGACISIDCAVFNSSNLLTRTWPSKLPSITIYTHHFYDQYHALHPSREFTHANDKSIVLCRIKAWNYLLNLNIR